MNPNLFPAAPAALPEGLTKLPLSYKIKAGLALLAILLFFVLYFGLIYFLFNLAIYAAIYEMEEVNKWTLILKLGAITSSTMLFFFAIKFVFKLKNPVPNNRIPVSKESQPSLFEFIDKVCKETGAAKPGTIYVDPDVNAYVNYRNIWLSLFFPVKKDLTIGLGLVGCLNISEFKAVMAHEFGHFAQRTMKIGSYINSANTIIHDMIFVRDKWDNTLEQWKQADFRLSFPAWILSPVIWIIRQILHLFYLFLNFMYSQLSKEMEFNADKVAVSSAGSDAIISGLWKLDFAVNHWNGSMNSAYLLSQKSLFTSNIYTHFNLSYNRESEEIKEKINALPQHELGGKKYFSGSANSTVSMYASHPSNDARERSAKSPFVAATEVDVSAWQLFDKPEEVQEDITQLIYSQYLQKTPTDLLSEADFEEFIVNENRDIELLKEMHNNFEDRFLYLPTEEEILEAKVISYDALKSQLEVLMKPIKNLTETFLEAQKILEGTSTQKTIDYGSKGYAKKELPKLMELIFIERNQIYENDFKFWDISFFRHFQNLAISNGDGQYYKDVMAQFKAVNLIFRNVLGVKNYIIDSIQKIQKENKLTADDAENISYVVKKELSKINIELSELDKLNFIPLSNIYNIEELKQSIITDGAFPIDLGGLFDNGVLDKVMLNIDNTLAHCQRIDLKNIMVILSYMKKNYEL